MAAAAAAAAVAAVAAVAATTLAWAATPTVTAADAKVRSLAVAVASNAFQLRRADASQWMDDCKGESADHMTKRWMQLETYVRCMHLRVDANKVDWTLPLTLIVSAMVRNGLDVTASKGDGHGVTLGTDLLHQLVVGIQANLEPLVEAALPHYKPLTGPSPRRHPLVWAPFCAQHMWATPRVFGLIVARSSEWELNARDQFGRSVLDMAVRSDSADVVRVLLAAANDDGSGLSTSSLSPATKVVSGQDLLQRKREAVKAFPAHLRALLHGVASPAFAEAGVRELICQFTIIPTP
jgi:hypothetical protein